MIFRKMTPQERHRQSKRYGARWMLTVVLSIAVLLGQSIPAMAGQYDPSSASLVEICGDGGSYFILVGADGQEQAPNCTHCDFCLVSTFDDQASHLVQAGNSVQIEFTIFNFSTVWTAIPEAPEQYWSASRGPPVASLVNKMTTLATFINKERAYKSSNEWSNPCV